MVIESVFIRENENDQTVFFTLTDDQGSSYHFHADIPKDVDIQKRLEADVRWYLKLIRCKEYPDSKEDGYGYYLDEAEDELAAIEEWIKDGCMLRDSETGEYTDKVEKVPWVGTHPPVMRVLDGEKLSVKTKQQFEGATTIEALKQVLADVFTGRQ